MIIKADKYRERVSKLRPRLFIGGKRVEKLMDHPITRAVIEAGVKTCELSNDPRYEDIMTAKSHLSGEKISRAVYIPASTEDMEKRLEMSRLFSRELGTCNPRCAEAALFPVLFATTWEMDKKKGTDYHQRFVKYLKYIQENDLMVNAAITDVRGDRSKRPLEQQDPDSYLHIVERKSDGIVVRGARQNQTIAYACDEILVVPGIVFRPGEEDYAVSFVVPNGTEGMTFISQYNAWSAEREYAEDIRYLGNPYGQRETCLIIFDNVFIPWERVFLCGETEYLPALLSRFAKNSRFNGAGACKAGFMDLIIGATKTISEYHGLSNKPRIIDEITRMIEIRDTCWACGIAAAHKGKEEPVGSGVWFSDEILSNITKLNAGRFWEVLELAGDIAGGIIATMPHERELENPEVKEYVAKYLKTSVPAYKRMRMIKFLQTWVCGFHGVEAWHGGGPRQAEMISLYRLTDLEGVKEVAKKLAGLQD